jgi:hypothetical protein
MIRSSLISLLLVCVICSFCGKNFESLGRHEWRCKRKIHHVENIENETTLLGRMPVITSPGVGTPKRSGIKCCCGKVCKGARGLKMHQRSCRVISGLNTELRADLDEENNNICAEDISNNAQCNSNVEETHEEFPLLKKGINLPQNDKEWSTANEYFKFALNLNPPIRSQDFSSSIIWLNDVIYNYFADNFGHVESPPNKLLVEKYKSHTTKELKKALKHLKSTNSDLTEIKYVARLVRNTLRNVNNNLTASNHDESFNHDDYIQRNFWGYVKNVFKVKDQMLPTFTMSECFSYFTKILAKINPTKVFNIPSWIPLLPDPTIEFNLDPPTYQQITNIIRKMKTSGSPSPLDQLSIICFKRCPFLRSYLTELIRAVWLSGSIPDEWKKACTILIHKKDDTNCPSNFRPITLETIPLKVFTSCLRNSIFTFLLANNFIEHNIQKGFTPHVSGTLEHTAQMAYIINQARIKQRSIVITLLDLKNAFGEINHNLIQCVLGYHHIPDHIKVLIKSLYTNFKTSIITSSFNTPFIPVGRGVLQGDCLSPLLFNLCFNTFIQHIKCDQYRQFGFSHKLLNPIHWFQFADDASVITSLESENQHLLNRFSLWCQWSDMIIRVDKCSTFGIKKALTKSIQYLPKLFINNNVIPTTKTGESFCYLGRYFDFGMTNNKHKSDVISLINDLMTDIDLKPLHPKNKLHLYSRYVLSKLSWHLTVAPLSKVWIIENIDSVVNQYIRKWLDVPVSGTLSNVFLTRNKFGLSIIPPSIKFTQCQSTLRNALRSSPNDSVKHLWKLTSNHTNIQYDAYNSTKEVIKQFRSSQEDKLENHLTSQGSFFSSITKFSLSQVNMIWSTCQSKLPKNIFNFTIRYINNTLPTRKNLVRWGLSSSTECSFCLNPESLLHVVAGCNSYLNRFSWRHDSVLNFIANFLRPMIFNNLYVDIPGFLNPSIVTGDKYRPDLLLTTKDNCLYILELTVGYETNLRNNIKRKQEKYTDVIKEQKKHFKSVEFINLSISALGVFDKESSAFLKMLNRLDVGETQTKYCIKKMINICIRSTYYIFCCRNKEWTNPDLMKF